MQRCRRNVLLGGGGGALALKCTKGGKKGKGNKEEGVEERKGGLLWRGGERRKRGEGAEEGEKRWRDGDKKGVGKNEGG